MQDEEKVNWMVQQWLQERGFTRALKALREVCSVHPSIDRCVHERMLTYMHTKIRTSLHKHESCMRTYMHMYIHIHSLTDTELHMHLCGYVCTRICIYVGKLVHILTHIDACAPANAWNRCAFTGIAYMRMDIHEYMCMCV